MRKKTEPCLFDLQDELRSVNDSRYHGALTLIDCAARLGPRAFEILVMQGERLLVGAERYPGEDFLASRDYITEYLEEAQDSGAYSAAAALLETDPAIRAHLVDLLDESLKQIRKATAIREIARLRRERDTERAPEMVPEPGDVPPEAA